MRLASMTTPAAGHKEYGLCVAYPGFLRVRLRQGPGARARNSARGAAAAARRALRAAA